MTPSSPSSQMSEIACYELLGAIIRSAVMDYNADRNKPKSTRSHWFTSAERFLFDPDGLERWVHMYGLPLNMTYLRKHACSDLTKPKSMYAQGERTPTNRKYLKKEYQNVESIHTRRQSKSLRCSKREVGTEQGRDEKDSV